MKKSILVTVSLTVCLALGFASCKKKGCTDPTASNYDSAAEVDDGSCKTDEPQATDPGTYVPSFEGTFATLVAIKTMTTQEIPGFGEYDMEIGIAVAAFSENGGESFLNAGKVSVDGKELTKASNNAYHYTLSATDTEGIEFGNTIEWNGTGADWPAFTSSTSELFPNIGSITSKDPDISEDYTLAVESAIYCDSVLFQIIGTSKNVLKIVGSNTKSYTFSKEELSDIGKGQGMIQVVGLTYNPETIDGKKYWNIREVVRTNMVTIK